jgi:hypothetical protein
LVAALIALYLGVAVAAVAFGRPGILVALGVPLVIAFALHASTVLGGGRDAREAFQRRRRRQPQDSS